jgi:hypothetical protein
MVALDDGIDKLREFNTILATANDRLDDAIDGVESDVDRFHDLEDRAVDELGAWREGFSDFGDEARDASDDAFAELQELA